MQRVFCSPYSIRRLKGKLFMHPSFQTTYAQVRTHIHMHMHIHIHHAHTQTHTHTHTQTHTYEGWMPDGVSILCNGNDGGNNA